MSDKPTVLWVDDQLEKNPYVRRFLEMNFEVVTARDYEEGLQTFKSMQPRPAGIVSDTQMPPFDDAGVMLLRDVRAIDPNIPFVLTSSDLSLDDIQTKLAHYGVEDQLTSKKRGGFVPKGEAFAIGETLSQLAEGYQPTNPSLRGHKPQGHGGHREREDFGPKY